jgi:hypothetical protein
MNHFGDMTYDEIVDVMLPLARKYASSLLSLCNVLLDDP